MSKNKLILSNGCSSTIPKVTPKNWKISGKESIEKDWVIHFYFRDPLFKDKYPNGKQVRIKGMNEYKTLGERREATQILLEGISDKLIKHRWNPITEEYMNEDALADESSTMIDCLRYYLKEKKISKDYRSDINSMINFLEVSINSLGLQFTSVSEIKRKDIRAVLKHQQQTRGISNNRYNKYKAQMSGLFDDMIEDEVIEYNPVDKIKPLPVEKKLREILSDKDRKRVYVHLKENYYTFWRFMMIYYASGARVKELLNVQVKDVDIYALEFKVTIQKGGKPKEVLKPINKSVVSLWIEVINEQNTDRLTINPKHYLFSRNLQKGIKPIRYEQITRRWKEHVKNKLGITADFAALTHLYADNIAAKLDIKHAQRLRSHTTDRMMKQHYAVNEKQRQMDRLKNVNNPFYEDDNDSELKVV
ncbi:Site-specific recombinase XerD [Tenacibaculum sp. 190524A02b]|uniref:tyrosine-type recombinase/integrase n=1 Tax=Tenacibaculum vairaonense TaxID=3137860 RepID=UPI0032B23094